ncbi:6-phosphogluconolactonase [Oceanomicrobium pacificus]|uniref:6-phosphogluconolactonase n=1 Tax=Oceanomicrobium pacificus TaxID=2692916 RepID=UPI002E2E1E41|nr:6-phosphogluconolactonase [Oceanomicrobium pacificus]
MIPVILHYPDAASQMSDLAEIVAGDLREALAARGRATLAVPGGTTPGPFLTALSQADLDWANVAVMLTDERFVPESSDRSNTALLRATLLQGPAAAATLLPFYREAEAPEHVLDEIASGIAPHLPIDSCVLGMGADMHTASLFPGADRLAEGLDAEGNATVLPMRAPGAPEPRLTLTAPVLRAARNLHLLIKGPEKKAALETALAGDDWAEAPVRAVLKAPAPIQIHFSD